MEKTDKEQKSEMIKAIAEVIDKNTSTSHDVWSVLHAIQDGLEFMGDKRYKYRNDLPYCIRSMRECLQKNKDSIIYSSGNIISLYDDITDELQEIIMLAGANAEGLVIINAESMREGLDAISDKYI